MFRRGSRFGGPGRDGGGGGEEGGEDTRPNVGISIRALWEQMEELIDLLDQVIEVAMSGGKAGGHKPLHFCLLATLSHNRSVFHAKTFESSSNYHGFKW